MNGRVPNDADLVAAIAAAVRNAVSALFAQARQRFYYCALVTTGEGLAPLLSAWSEEALDQACRRAPHGEASRSELRWSYADSPFCNFGAEYFAEVRRLFALRPILMLDNSGQWSREVTLRLQAMEKAMAQLDAEGLFGRGLDRTRIVITVEVAPPDSGNTERVLRLNPPEALTAWLKEAAES